MSAATATSTASMIDWISSTVAAENASAIAVLYPSIFPFTTPSSSAAVLLMSTRWSELNFKPNAGFSNAALKSASVPFSAVVFTAFTAVS